MAKIKGIYCSTIESLQAQGVHYEDFMGFLGDKPAEFDSVKVALIAFAEENLKCWVSQYAEAGGSISLDPEFLEFDVNTCDIDVYDNDVSEFQCRICSEGYEYLEDFMEHIWNEHLTELIEWLKSEA